jgi:hypothetical protein
VRSHIDACLRVVTVAFVFVVAASAAAAAREQQSLEGRTARPGLAEITRAIEKVKADPNLATEQTIKTLEWKKSTDTKRSDRPQWLAWIAGLFRWLEQSARALIWCAAIVLAGILAAFIVRRVREHGAPAGKEQFVVPTHVRDLDIRPETLPADIGAAARALWDKGEHRASLALLYRGLLSRLVHLHRVPIRDASTEGDCLALAARHLTQARHEYASGLVRVWQRLVYGGEGIPASTVYALCDGFASALDLVARPGPTVSRGDT